MKYQNIITKEVKTYNEIKQANRNISYPKAGAEMLGENWKLIVSSPQPVYDVDSEGVREIAPVDYVQTWEVYDLSQDERDAILEAKLESEEQRGWDAYKRDEDAHNKQQWKLAGKPVFTP